MDHLVACLRVVKIGYNLNPVVMVSYINKIYNSI